MTDDAEQYYSAWKDVFGENQTKKILCAWHVDRAWRKAIHQLIKDHESKVNIYHQLCVLLSERDEAKFRVILQEFLTYTENHHYEFHKYFKNHYCKRVHQWATCYRHYAAVNTNMFVEAFHRVLKMVYLHHKQNRRVDVLLVTLLRISRDKAFDWFHKMEKGKVTHRICEINRRHKAAELIQKQNICKIKELKTNERWIIASDTVQYTITQQNEKCMCKIRCSFCMTCPHNFTCTCLDSTLRSTVCKHIHYLVMKEVKSASKESGFDSPDDELPGKVLRILSDGRRKESTLQELKESVRELNSEIYKFVSDIDAIKVLKQRLQATVSIAMTSTKQIKTTLIPKKTYAPNTNHEKQFQFHSTRKKSKSSITRMSKPSKEEVEHQREKMGRETSVFCGICLKENDSEIDNDTFCGSIQLALQHSAHQN